MEKGGRLFHNSSSSNNNSNSSNRAPGCSSRVQLVQPRAACSILLRWHGGVPHAVWSRREFVACASGSTAPEVYYGDAHAADERGQRVLREMKRESGFWAMRAGVKERVSSADPRDRDAERAVVRALDELGYHDQQIRNVVHGAHARGLRRQIAGVGSLPTELRCLYPELYPPSPPPPSRCSTSVSPGAGTASTRTSTTTTTTASTNLKQQQRQRQQQPQPGEDLADPEPLDHVRKASARWRANVADELRALAAEKGGRFARRRVDTSAAAAGERGGEGPEGWGTGNGSGSGRGAGGIADNATDPSGGGGGGGTGGFLFDSADLLDAVSMIRSPNRSDFLAVENDWGMVHVQLRVKSLEELRESYRELSPELHQTGLDDRGGFGEDRFTAERLSQGEKILKSGFAPEAMEYARRGVTDSLRPAVWRAMLGLPKVLTQQEIEYFRGLMSDVDRAELVTDELYSLDVQFISDDDKYFPFEETLHDVILAFSRDPWVLRHSEVTLHEFVPIAEGVAGTSDSAGFGGGVWCPPCGVQPFRGLVNYAAVLCFLFEEREAVYFALRAMFARYWCRLNAVRSGPGMLLRLLKLFETLVQRHHPQLVLKLLQLGVQPLQLAMPWIQFGFVTYLEADQVLLLWDRLLGYDSLDLLSVLAASVLVFRANLVMQVSDASAVTEIFSDGRQLEVVPLLQAFMFPAW
ncbi:unnamed protein product [Pylaiella littoralis]